MNQFSRSAYRSRGWPWRFLGRLGRAMGATINRLDKAAAVRLATKANRALPPNGWTYADAMLVHDAWLVVLERSASAHIVEVDAYTGDTRSLATAMRRGGAERHRRTRRTVLTSCSGWRGDPVILSSRYRDVMCGKGSGFRL